MTNDITITIRFTDRENFEYTCNQHLTGLAHDALEELARNLWNEWRQEAE